MWKRILWASGVALFLLAIVFGLRQAQQSPQSKPENILVDKGKLTHAPEPLGGLYRQPLLIRENAKAQFLGLEKKLAGIPMVINKWASWCGPCRLELPLFRQAALHQGAKVAFLGVNSSDNHEDAQTFLKQQQLPFPSFEDPQNEIAKLLQADRSFPTTVFIDPSGERFIHQGGYVDLKALENDIQRYALKKAP